MGKLPPQKDPNFGNLVQSGHVDGTSFYGDKEKGIKPGHDHYDKQGNTRKGGDRGGYN